jgi:predicted ATP-binding protein involved in virulence
MQVSSIHLKNYRCFRQLDLEFHPRLTVIVAKNGGGKTAILDAVAFSLGLFVSTLSSSKRVFHHSDVLKLKVRDTGLNEMETQYPLELQTQGVLAGRPQTWSRELTELGREPTRKNAHALIGYANALRQAVRAGELEPPLPMVAHYGTGRLWKIKSLTESKGEHTKSRLSGYEDCLDPFSSYKWFVDWLRYITRAEVQYLQENSTPSEFSRLLEAVRQPINTCLRVTNWQGIKFNLGLNEVTAQHPEHGTLPVSLLSDGIRNMIGLVADIAYRMVRLNPQLGIAACQETPGVVLIDEVDMHLHPEWQQTVLLNLQHAFPKIQFIVTTHSPQVLTTVAPESIRVLKWQAGQVDIEFVRFSLGAESRLLLEQVMDVKSRPPEVEVTKKLNEYLRLVDADQWDTEQAKALRRFLDQSIHGFDPILLRADSTIKLKKYNRTLQ